MLTNPLGVNYDAPEYSLTISGQSSSIIKVRFTPQGTGTRTAALSFTTNIPGQENAFSYSASEGDDYSIFLSGIGTQVELQVRELNGLEATDETVNTDPDNAGNIVNALFGSTAAFTAEGEQSTESILLRNLGSVDALVTEITLTPIGTTELQFSLAKQGESM